MAFEFEHWDSGRLQVNAAFAPLLRRHHLTTFESWMNYATGEVAREVGNRVTKRMVLQTADGNAAFYLKRHAALPLREFIKPLLRLAWPVYGAANEWNAILRFHDAEIPTMTPVALGVSGRRSFLVTQSLESRQSLLDWIGGRDKTEPDSQDVAKCPPNALRDAIQETARIARTMHEAGLHHQDFYLNHLLIPREADVRDIRVIDLGRVRHQRPLAMRWIVKDLAQLDFSARRLSCKHRLRFLRLYLGRPLTRDDRRLIRKIHLKSLSIARHTEKNCL